jgi:hypothetical protein
MLAAGYVIATRGDGLPVNQAAVNSYQDRITGQWYTNIQAMKELGGLPLLDNQGCYLENDEDQYSMAGYVLEKDGDLYRVAQPSSVLMKVIKLVYKLHMGREDIYTIKVDVVDRPIISSKLHRVVFIEDNEPLLVNL